MPYSSISSLPDSVKYTLPAHARDIYKQAFNAAWQQYKSKPDVEETSRRIAWAAVKKSYYKDSEGKWSKKAQAE